MITSMPSTVTLVPFLVIVEVLYIPFQAQTEPFTLLVYTRELFTLVIKKGQYFLHGMNWLKILT